MTHKNWRKTWIVGPLLAMSFFATPSYAIDPPYHPQMERLLEVLGSLYFLQPLCTIGEEDWRVFASDLVALDNPDADRRERLTGAFNAGFETYARIYRSCTPSAQEALGRLQIEAENSARDLHTRFAE